MLTALMIIIFIAFIGVGLPDSVLGTAWPLIYREFDLPISLAGYIAATVSVGTITSSLLSARLINRFGTGLVTAVSTLLTALALLGYGCTGSPVFFFLLAIPMGLGAGSVDIGLNSFVAMHYSASQMSFLHCFYGLGVAASPFVMSLVLGEDGNWRRGYLVIAGVQFVLAAICFLALPLWRRAEKRDREAQQSLPHTLSIRQMLRLPGVALSCFAFFTSCALELTAGAWSSSYFVNTKGLEADSAAAITMLFYIGLAGGRFLSGVFSGRLGRRRILRLSLLILFFAILLFLLPVWPWLSAAAVLFIGLGIGPIYPNLMHLTPNLFGEESAQSVIGLQQSAASAGIMVMPWLFGLLAQGFSTALLPAYLLLLCVLYGWTFFALMRTAAKEQK